MSEKFASWKNWIVATFLIAGAAILVGIPIWQFAMFPQTSQLMRLPESWQGGIEAIAIAVFLAAVQNVTRSRVRLFAVIAISELYLRRHGVDLSLFLDLFFLECLIALGGSLQRWMGAPRPTDTADYLRNFVLGLLSWSLCAWALSALGMGSLNALRTLTLAAGIVGIAAKAQPFSVFVYKRVDAAPRAARYAFAILFAWLLVLCAKTATVFGFDPLWYGLRGERVLLDHGSVYTSLGLVSAVHYFPKLYEMLLLPLSGLGSASLISGMSVMLFVLTAATANALLDRLGVTRRSVRIAVIAACVTLPAIANPALDSKPDTLAALLLMIAWLHAAEFADTRKISAALWAVACLIVATQAKLTAIPFAAAITLASAWITIRDRRPATLQNNAAGDRIAWVVFALSVIVTGFVTARTILLAGMPTIGPDAFFHLWKSIGFDLKPPAGTLPWTSVPNWKDVPLLAIDLTLRPQRLEHIIVTWTGNLWLWCGLVFFAAARLWRSNQTRVAPHAAATIGKALMVTGVLVMFGLGYGVRGSDGNYFIAALVPAMLIGTVAVGRVLQPAPRISAVAGICFFSFLALQTTYSFISSSWLPGTHAFNHNFHRGFHEFRRKNRALLAANGLGEIEYFLRHLHRSARVVDCVEESVSMRLPARVESIEVIFYSRPEYLATPDTFLDFLASDKIEFLIMPNGDDAGRCTRFPAVIPAVKQIADDKSVTAIHDQGYVMYDIAGFTHSRLSAGQLQAYQR